MTLVDPAVQSFAAIKPSVIMNIVFTDPEDFVEAIYNTHEEDPSVLEVILDNCLLETGAENSISDCKESTHEASLKMFFGLKECRAIFGQATNQGAFARACGNKEGTCERGHVALDKA